jgi:hypothetical protein
MPPGTGANRDPDRVEPERFKAGEDLDERPGLPFRGGIRQRTLVLKEFFTVQPVGMSFACPSQGTRTRLAFESPFISGPKGQGLRQESPRFFGFISALETTEFFYLDDQPPIVQRHLGLDQPKVRLV